MTTRRFLPRWDGMCLFCGSMTLRNEVSHAHTPLATAPAELKRRLIARLVTGVSDICGDFSDWCENCGLHQSWHVNNRCPTQATRFH